jgi:hypothetical protein
MKKHLLFLTVTSMILMLAGCSGVKVLNSWKSPQANTMRKQNILVIARTDNDKVRTIFEDEIVNQLHEEGYSAVASYVSIPKVKPDRKLSEEEVAAYKKEFREQGYNGIVITVIKENEELAKISKEGGYYAGGSYYGYYPMYYGDFYGYYRNPASYSTYGNWEEEKMELQTAHNFILETLAYNLDLPEDKQLVTIVTTKIEEPDDLIGTAKTYVKKVMQSLKK